MDQPNEWMTARQVMKEYSVSKSTLYGRISRLVRVRKLPGDTKKWNRADLDKLCQQYTSVPQPVIVPPMEYGRPFKVRQADLVRPRFLSLAWR